MSSFILQNDATFQLHQQLTNCSEDNRLFTHSRYLTKTVVTDRVTEVEKGRHRTCHRGCVATETLTPLLTCVVLKSKTQQAIIFGFGLLI